MGYVIKGILYSVKFDIYLMIIKLNNMSCFQRLSSRYSYPRNRKVKEVYVLRLKEGKYYVGESINVRKRVWTHVNLNGAAWTRQYGVIGRIPTISPQMGAFWELNETLEQMKRHGIDNVRGSMFSNIRLTQDQRSVAVSLYCEKENLCRKCGSHTHLETQCEQISKTSWMSDFLGPMPMPQPQPQSIIEPLKRAPDPRNKRPPVLQCVVCDSILAPNSHLNYCGDFCRRRHSVHIS